MSALLAVFGLPGEQTSAPTLAGACNRPPLVVISAMFPPPSEVRTSLFLGFYVGSRSDFAAKWIHFR